MRTWSSAEHLDKTALRRKSAKQSESDTSKSALLEESLEGIPFSFFFESTGSFFEPPHSELQFVDLDLELARTPVLSGEPVRRVASRRALRDTLEPEVSAGANATRVTLLARKYVSKGKFSEEENARLAIVTERIRQLMPAVAASDFERLEAALTRAREIANVDNEIRANLRKLPRSGD